MQISRKRLNEKKRKNVRLRHSVDCWYEQYTVVCGRSRLPGGRVDLEKIRKVDRASRS